MTGKRGYVYILASKKNGTLYIGVTSDLVQRVHQHKTDAVPGFSSRYQTKTLVHFEVFDDIQEAIKREKALKAWQRAWKIRLIEVSNPEWQDLWENISAP